MRISDWSSDVCSSDLLEPRQADGIALQFSQQPAFRAVLAQAADQGLERLGLVWVAIRYVDAAIAAFLVVDQLEGIGGAAQAAAAEAVAVELQQIGRASWRGRVGQYVWISGGGVA